MARSKKYEKNLAKVQSYLDDNFDKKVQVGMHTPEEKPTDKPEEKPKSPKERLMNDKLLFKNGKKQLAIDMKKDIENEYFLKWVLSYDKKDHAKQVKENMKPFETLFFEVGAEILKNVEGFIAANPKKAVQNMKKKLSSAISKVN